MLSAVTSYARGDLVRSPYKAVLHSSLMSGALQGGVFTSMSGLLKTATGGGQRAEQKARATKTSPADVVRAMSGIHFGIPYLQSAYQISWSGCKDSQTSADTFEAGQSTGAMSYVSCLFTHTQHRVLTNLVCRLS